MAEGLMENQSHVPSDPRILIPAVIFPHLPHRLKQPSLCIQINFTAFTFLEPIFSTSLNARMYHSPSHACALMSFSEFHILPQSLSHKHDHLFSPAFLLSPTMSDRLMGKHNRFRLRIRSNIKSIIPVCKVNSYQTIFPLSRSRRLTAAFTCSMTVSDPPSCHSIIVFRIPKSPVSFISWQTAQIIQKG